MSQKTGFHQKVIFASFSKRNFYLRSQISIFILNKNAAPISPFMNFDYNLLGLVNKSHIRIANNSMIARCHELWVFGEVSDGVLVEIFLAKKQKKKIRYFTINDLRYEFEEITADKVVLEDVSPWMWELVLAGKNLTRWHPRLRFKKSYPLIYPAYSKKNFYWQMHISTFCLKKKNIPLNPFMLFRYFLGDSLPREKIYSANNSIIQICDEIWTFGDISDGVLREVELAKKNFKKVRHFNISEGNPVKFRQVNLSSLEYEEEAQRLLDKKTTRG